MTDVGGGRHGYGHSGEEKSETLNRRRSKNNRNKISEEMTFRSMSRVQKEEKKEAKDEEGKEEKIVACNN